MTVKKSSKHSGPNSSNADSAIHRINHYPVDKAISSPNAYPLDSDLSVG